MHTFALPDWTPAKIESITNRIERHGKHDVVAVSIGFRISGTNMMFDRLSPDLRDGLYRAAEGQEDLPGVPRTTPHLRAPDLAGVKIPLDKVKALEGATVYLDWGIDGEDEPIELGTSKVDKFAIIPFDGGSGDTFVRVGSSDISTAEIGNLVGKLGQEIRIRVEPPAKQEPASTDAEADPNQRTLDGTTGAEIGEQSEARRAADAMFDGPPDSDNDTTGEFLAQHAEE